MNAEDLLFRLMALVERLGVWLSLVAWLAVALAALAMAYALRNERKAIWRPAALVGILALAANLSDYFVTLKRSPDLRLEANPLWRNVTNHLGLSVAKWYGLTGKIIVSLLAAQLFAFYLGHRKLLFPAGAGSLTEFLARMGTRAASRRERLLGLFSIFSFFFSGINLLYFYVAFLNSVETPELLARLPSLPVSLLAAIGILAILFVLLTYRAFRASQPQNASGS